MTYHEIGDILNADLFKSPFNTSCSNWKQNFRYNTGSFPTRLAAADTIAAIYWTESVACKVN